MRQPITQKHGFGCGVACVAFAASVSYNYAIRRLGEIPASLLGFTCKELIMWLESSGHNYKFKNLKPGSTKNIQRWSYSFH